MKQNTKDWLQYCSALFLIVSAVAIAFVSFLLTLTIGGGVLCYIGEALGVALAIFGVTQYFKNQMVEFQTKVNDTLNKIEKGEKINNEDGE